MFGQSLVKLFKEIKSIIKDVKFWFNEKLSRIPQTKMKLMISLKEQLTFSNECLVSIKKNKRRKKSKKKQKTRFKKKPNQMTKFLLLILLKQKFLERILLESINETLRFIKFKNQRQVYTLSNTSFQKKPNDQIKYFDRKMMTPMMKLMKVSTQLKLSFLET